MANTIRIKRRAAGGAAGAPSSLQNAELAFNEQDNTLYYGTGTGGSGGSATTVIAIAGPGTFAPLASPALTGTPTAPTATTGDSSTQVATTAFVNAEIANDVVRNDTAATVAMDGTQSAGTSSLLARADHVHPTDTSRAPLASPTFTGTPAAPTAAVDTNTTQVATTAFVLAQAAAVAPADLGVAAVGTSTRYARADHAHDMPRIDQLDVPTASVAFNGQKITGLADPVNAQDAATKNYVDLTVQGLDPKQSVRAATTANIATLSGLLTIDGVTLVGGDRVLVKNQTTASENGIYLAASGSWTRAIDMDTWAEVPNAYVFVEQGTVNADMGFVCTSDQGGTLNTTDITWVQFNGAGQVTAGAGLTKTGNQLDVGTASTSRIVVNADNIDLASGVIATVGTYQSVTVDTYGRVTAGTNPTTLSGYGITDAQPLDATLTALAGVTTAADKLIYATGADTFATTDLSTFGRSLIDDADASAARTTLGLGTIATQAANNVSISGGSISNLTTFDGITIDGGSF
jgi:phage-related tail fiber protein